MQDFTTRPLQAKDLPQVLDMVQALAAHHGDKASADLGSLRRDALGAHPWVRVLVAQGGGRLLGYAALCPLAQVQFGARGLDMQNLFVRPQARRQGVGAALIAACQQHAKKVGCTYLAVGTHPANTAAGQVYLAAGFEPRPAPGPRFGMRL